MAKKEKVKKAPLKERNPYAYYRNQWLGFKGAKWLSIIAPFVTIFAVNFDKYFYYDDGSQVKMSLGCVLACFVGGIAMWREVKKTDEKGNELSGVLGWAVAFALCYFFSAVLQDLTLIMGCALAGQLVGFTFEVGAKNRKVLMETCRTEQAKSNITMQILKEMTGIKDTNNNTNRKKDIPYE